MIGQIRGEKCYETMYRNTANLINMKSNLD